MADGGGDMLLNIRFGQPFPVRFFPDLEAAKAYVLSGLDQARALLLRVGGGHELLHRVADGVRDVRLHVAADRIPAAMAASVELTALAAKARQIRGEALRRVRRHRPTVALSLCAYFLVVAYLIVPFAPDPTPATVAPHLVQAVVLPHLRMRLAFGVTCLVAPFVHATTAAGLLLSMAWRLWYIGAAEEAERLREGERVAVEIERTVAAVADILYRLIN